MSCHARTLIEPSWQKAGDGLPSALGVIATEHSLITGGVVAGERIARARLTVVVVTGATGGRATVVVVTGATVVVVEGNVVVVVARGTVFDLWVWELAALTCRVGVELPPASNPIAIPAPRAAATATAMPIRTTVLLRSVITGESSVMGQLRYCDSLEPAHIALHLASLTRVNRYHGPGGDLAAHARIRVVNLARRRTI